MCVAGRFVDKRVIITGASSGIGAAVARQLASEGACVVLVTRRAELLEALAREIGADRTLAIAADVTDRSAMAAMLEQTQARFGGVDILINNAGCHVRGSLEQVAEQILACAYDGRRERAVPRLAGSMCALGYVFPRARGLLKPWLEKRGRAKKEPYVQRMMPEDASLRSPQCVRPRTVSSFSGDS